MAFGVLIYILLLALTMLMLKLEVLIIRQAKIQITYAGGTQIILVFILVRITESLQETAACFSSINASLMMIKITVIVVLDLAVCFCAEFVNYNVD